MQEASKMLEEGPKILYRKLRKAGVLIDGTGLHNQARHQYVRQGYFVIDIVKYTRGEVEHHASKTLVTPSGLAFIRQLLDQQHAPEATHDTNDQCNRSMGETANASPQA